RAITSTHAPLVLSAFPTRRPSDLRRFVRAFDEAGKPIATLCHGPWVLASAGLVGGRSLTSWPGIRDDLVHAGAIWLDREGVHDRDRKSTRLNSSHVNRSDVDCSSN